VSNDSPFNQDAFREEHGLEFIQEFRTFDEIVSQISANERLSAPSKPVNDYRQLISNPSTLNCKVSSVPSHATTHHTKRTNLII